MRLTATAAVTAAAALLSAPLVGAQPPKKPPKQPSGTPSLSIRASATTVTFGATSRITGRLRGGNNGGQSVALDQNPFPFPAFVLLTTGRTDAQGDYGFTVSPNRHTKYRARTTPSGDYSISVASPEVLVKVRLRVGIRLSDATPRRGQRVRFFGAVAPKHNGRAVYVQRRRRDGRWVTVARTVTRDAAGDRSRYSRRVRVFRDGLFRVRVRGHSDHATGTSRARTVRVH